LGREFAQQNVISPETSIKIDQEIKNIIVRNYDRAKGLLEQNRHLLEKVAEALLECEVLDADQIRRICEGLPVKEVLEAQQESEKEPAKAKRRPVIVSQN